MVFLIFNAFQISLLELSIKSKTGFWSSNTADWENVNLKTL